MTKLEDSHRALTERIITALEAGEHEPFWSPPWADGIDVWSPANPITGKRYTGGNRFYLGAWSWIHGYGQHWATYKQWASLSRHTPACVDQGEPQRARCEQHGCELVHVRKGEKGTIAARPIIDDDNELKGFRAYTVFAAQQVEGYVEPEPFVVEIVETTVEEMDRADVYARMIGAVVNHTDVRGASYSPTSDDIEMPAHHRWEDANRYWATLIHELIHWTGHPSRLNRLQSVDRTTEEYGREELVAELGATFHLSHLERRAHFREDHLPYLKSWLKILKDDPKALWNAATAAEHASKKLGELFNTRLTEGATTS